MALIRKTIALVMILLIAVSCIPISAFADNESVSEPVMESETSEVIETDGSEEISEIIEDSIVEDGVTEPQEESEINNIEEDVSEEAVLELDQELTEDAETVPQSSENVPEEQEIISETETEIDEEDVELSSVAKTEDTPKEAEDTEEFDREQYFEEVLEGNAAKDSDSDSPLYTVNEDGETVIADEYKVAQTTLVRIHSNGTDKVFRVYKNGELYGEYFYLAGTVYGSNTGGRTEYIAGEEKGLVIGTAKRGDVFRVESDNRYTDFAVIRDLQRNNEDPNNIVVGQEFDITFDLTYPVKLRAPMLKAAGGARGSTAEDIFASEASFKAWLDSIVPEFIDVSWTVTEIAGYDENIGGVWRFQVNISRIDMEYNGRHVVFTSTGPGTSDSAMCGQMGQGVPPGPVGDSGTGQIYRERYDADNVAAFKAAYERGAEEITIGYWYRFYRPYQDLVCIQAITYKVQLPRNGKLALTKESADTAITDRNTCYSFEGTIFQVSDDSGNTVATITVKTDGTADEVELPAGTYTVRETVAGKGYGLNPETKTVEIRSGETTSVSFANEPIYDPASIYIRKWDPVADRVVPQGKGSFKGAQYRFDFYGNTSWSGEPVASWILETDENGIIRYDDAHKVSGPDMYKVGDGYAWPLGSLKITEVKAPTGYLMSTNELRCTITQNGNLGKITWTTETLSLIKAYADGIQVREDAISGGVRIGKNDALLGTNAPEGEASLGEAEFTIYANTAMEVGGTAYAKDDAIMKITTDAEGNAATSNDALPYGDYYIKETKAPVGYKLNDRKQEFTIRTDGQMQDFSAGANRVDETPVTGGVKFRKVDAETNGDPIGNALLEGTEITIYNNSANPVVVEGRTIRKGEAAFVLNTDAEGYAETAKDLLPYGTYYAKETKSPEGYQLNEDWRVDFSIRADGQTVDAYTGTKILKDQVIRGDLAMMKLDIDGNYKPNIPFMIVALDKEGNEGEWHVIVTDENGMIDTSSSARPHSGNTNSLDQYVDGGVFTDTSKLDPSVGVWFGGTDPDDSKGALPYGSYKIYELQTEQLKREQINLLESEIISVNEPNKVITLHPMVNLNVQLTSEASSPDTGMDMIPAAETVRIQDRVSYTNLTAGRRYTMETQFVLKSDIQNILGTASKDFYPEEGTFGTNTVKGSVSLETVIDTKDCSDNEIVAFDYLYQYVNGTRVLIASHTDLEDKAQTLKVPQISTVAKDTVTRDQVGAVKADAEIVDSVMYSNLKRGEIFKLEASLVDAKTGEVLVGKDGSPLIAEKRFMCGKETDETEMPAFKLDADDYAGISVVVFEKLYWIDEEHDNTETLMAVHESLDDSDQTISFPDIHTTAADVNTESHAGVTVGDTTIEDVVKLENLVVGKEYTVTGKLVYKEDSGDGKHKAGDPVTVKEDSLTMVTFIAESQETEVALQYVVDGSELAGNTAVVFEDLIHNGVKVASHADIEDREQSVYFPMIRTKAIDKASGTPFITKGKDTVFTDEVSYVNLVPGQRYIISGKLVSRDTGDALGITGESGEFIPIAPNGTVTVEFKADTDRLLSSVIVVFEDLYLVKDDGTKVLIAKHEDLNDTDQSLYNPDIRTTATDKNSDLHETQGKPTTVIVDTVSYKGLKVGEEYTVSGVLMDKATGEPILVEGKKVESIASFTAEKDNGTVEIPFEFDGTGLVGKTVVVFESLVYKDVEIAVHADISDKDQSVSIIDIRTSAKDKVSDSEKATLSRTAVIVDTVTYSGLIPGKTYTLSGTVMLKGNGTELYQNGLKVTGLTEFVPDKPQGETEVSFVVDTEQLQGQTLVVFEKLYAGSMTNETLESEVPIATHEDLEDKGQTIAVPIRPHEYTPPHTGDEANIWIWGSVGLLSGIGVFTTVLRKKKRM